jgi:hypothetical protein
MFTTIQTPKQLEDLVLGDVRREMAVFYEFYYLDAKQDIFCIEVYADKMIVILEQPAVEYQEKFLTDKNRYEWNSMYHEEDKTEDSLNKDRDIIYAWNFPNFPIQVTPDIADICVEICLQDVK